MSRLTQLTSRRDWHTMLTDYLGMIVALALLILVFSLSTRHFFSAVNFQMIANQIPAAVLVATGMTYVLIIAGIDLSVGSVLGFCGAVMGACLLRWHWPLWATLPCSPPA